MQSIKNMVDAIVAEVDPEEIVLFGSHATGRARMDSDIDLLVIEREPFGSHRSRWREAARLYRRLAGSGVAKDILLYSRAEVDMLRQSASHVVARAMRDGQVVYARP